MNSWPTTSAYKVGFFDQRPLRFKAKGILIGSRSLIGSYQPRKVNPDWGLFGTKLSFFLELAREAVRVTDAPPATQLSEVAKATRATSSAEEPSFGRHVDSFSRLASSVGLTDRKGVGFLGLVAELKTAAACAPQSV